MTVLRKGFPGSGRKKSSPAHRNRKAHLLSRGSHPGMNSPADSRTAPRDVPNICPCARKCAKPYRRLRPICGAEAWCGQRHGDFTTPQGGADCGNVRGHPERSDDPYIMMFIRSDQDGGMDAASDRIPTPLPPEWHCDNHALPWLIIAYRMYCWPAILVKICRLRCWPRRATYLSGKSDKLPEFTR